MNISNKILQYIENWKLKLVEWKRKWFNLIISTQELNQFRNNIDGFIIDVYDNNDLFLERINLENKYIYENWWVHNKLYIMK